MPDPVHSPVTLALWPCLQEWRCVYVKGVEILERFGTGSCLCWHHTEEKDYSLSLWHLEKLFPGQEFNESSVSAAPETPASRVGVAVIEERGILQC